MQSIKKTIILIICCFNFIDCDLLLDEKFLVKKIEFSNKMKDSIIEPGWIINVFLDLTQEEFIFFWDDFVDYFIINSNEKNIDKRIIIEICNQFSIFLDNLFYKKDSKIFFCKNNYLNIDDEHKIEKIVLKNKCKSYYDFYAFYFDKISELFVESIIFNENDFYKKNELYIIFYKLRDVYQNLLGSDYEIEYSFCLKKYGELLCFVEIDNKENLKE